MQERSKIKQLFFGDIDDYGWWLIGLFLFTLLLTPILSRYVLDFELEAISFAGYFALYVLRYSKKKSGNHWNRFKLIFTFVLLIVLIQDSYFRAFGLVPMFVGYSSYFTLYFIDRIVLKAMKKFSIVLNIILTLVTLFFVVYSQIQANLISELKWLEYDYAKEAKLNTKRAEAEAANAREAEMEALKALHECQTQNQ